VKTFRLGVDSQVPFEFLPGQFIILAFEIFDRAKGRSVRKNRAFSISSSPMEKNYLEITVKKTGRISTYMHEVVKEKDLLTIKNRSGEFYFQEGFSDELVLIAGGTGIAPLMSMVRNISQRKLPVKITLLYSNKTPGDIIFYKEIQALESSHSNFRCIHTITRPEGYNWRGPTGRINQELLEQNVSNKQALFYICGPKAMIQATAEFLKGLGVHPSRIKIEKWD
jgi:ferredoxin-NADP reductase